MIVPMNLSHVEAIAEIEKLCFSDPWSVRSIAYELESPWSRWLVALEGEQVAGYVGSQLVPPEADVMNLAVHPNWRGQGIGRALMEAMLAQLRSEGIEELALEVRESNNVAISLYTALGFTLAGKRQRYYVNPTEDALILRKELSHADIGS